MSGTEESLPGCSDHFVSLLPRRNRLPGHSHPSHQLSPTRQCRPYPLRRKSATHGTADDQIKLQPLVNFALKVIRHTGDFAASTLASSIRRLRAVPDLAGSSSGAFGFVRVERVARGVVACVFGDEDGKGEEGLVCLHFCGEEVVPVGGLKRYLEGDDGGLFRVDRLEE